MMKNKRKFQVISLPGATSSALRGKQSVRATFKLSRKAIDAMSIVSIHLGIKQKSLFDHLMSDLDVLNIIANEVEPSSFKREDSVQKTFVLSRNTLSLLEKVCNDFSASRDALVEYSIQRLMPIIAKEQEKHKKRKDLLEALRKYAKDGQTLLNESRKMLEEDDPVYTKIEALIYNCEKACTDVEAFVERGEMIEEF